MYSKTITQNLTLNTAASTAAVVLSDALVPFLPNNTAVVCMVASVAPGTSFTLEGRNDDGAWAALTDSAGDNVEILTADLAGTFFFDGVVLTQEVRATVVGTAVGTGTIALLGN